MKRFQLVLVLLLALMTSTAVFAFNSMCIDPFDYCEGDGACMLYIMSHWDELCNNAGISSPDTLPPPGSPSGGQQYCNSSWPPEPPPILHAGSAGVPAWLEYPVLNANFDQYGCNHPYWAFASQG